MRRSVSLNTEVRVVAAPASRVSPRRLVTVAVSFTAAVALLLMAREKRQSSSADSTDSLSFVHDGLDAYTPQNLIAEGTGAESDGLARILQKWADERKAAEDHQDVSGSQHAHNGADESAFIPYWNWNEDNLDAGSVDPERREYFEFIIPAGKKAGDSVVTSVPSGKLHAGEQIEFDVPDGLKGGDEVEVRIRGGDVKSVPPPASSSMEISSAEEKGVNLTQVVEELKEKLLQQRSRFVTEIRGLKEEGRRAQEQLDVMNNTILMTKDFYMRTLNELSEKLKAAHSELDVQDTAFAEVLSRLLFRKSKNKSAISISEQSAWEVAYNLFNSSDALAEDLRKIEISLSNSSFSPRNLSDILNRLQDNNGTGLLTLGELRKMQNLLLEDDSQLMDALKNKKELERKISSSIQEAMNRVSEAKRIRGDLQRQRNRDKDLESTEDLMLSEVMRLKSRLLSSIK
eukprot:753759-Hanusia_phi.AAC.1